MRHRLTRRNSADGSGLARSASIVRHRWPQIGRRTSLWTSTGATASEYTTPHDALALVLLDRGCDDDGGTHWQSSMEVAVSAGVDYTVLVMPYSTDVAGRLDLAVRYVD